MPARTRVFPLLFSFQFEFLVLRGLGFARQRRDELRALVDELFALAAAVRRPNGVLAEERERDGRVAVSDDRIRQDARYHRAPADRFRRRRARQSTKHDLIRRDLDEVIVAALRNTVDLPQRRLGLEIEILRRAAAEDDAAVALTGQHDRADLVDVEVRI